MHLDNEICFLKIKGYLDITTAEELENTIDSVVNSGNYKVIVDLNDVEYISSMGWSVFISRLKNVRESRGDIKLVGMQPDVYEVYKLLEFDLFLSAYDTIDEAIANFTQNGTIVYQSEKKY